MIYGIVKGLIYGIAKVLKGVTYGIAFTGL
jgi:hypothetical protein